MISPSHPMFRQLAATAIVALCLALPLNAQQAIPGIKGGSIDMENVMKNCRQSKELEKAASRELERMGMSRKQLADAQKKRVAYWTDLAKRLKETAIPEEDRQQLQDEATTLKEEISAAAQELGKLQTEQQARSREIVTDAHRALKQQVQQIAQQIARERGITFLVNIGEGSDVILADPAALPDISELVLERLNRQPSTVPHVVERPVADPRQEAPPAPSK